MDRHRAERWTDIRGIRKAAGLSTEQQQQLENAHARVNGLPEPYPALAPTDNQAVGPNGTKYSINWGAIETPENFDAVRSSLLELARSGNTRAYDDLTRLNWLQVGTHAAAAGDLNLSVHDRILANPSYQAGVQRGMDMAMMPTDPAAVRVRGQDFANPANWGAPSWDQRYAAAAQPLYDLWTGMAIAGGLGVGVPVATRFLTSGIGKEMLTSGVVSSGLYAVWNGEEATPAGLATAFGAGVFGGGLIRPGMNYLATLPVMPRAALLEPHWGVGWATRGLGWAYGTGAIGWMNYGGVPLTADGDSWWTSPIMPPDGD